VEEAPWFSEISLGSESKDPGVGIISGLIKVSSNDNIMAVLVPSFDLKY
jgi:hypothetical protein